MTARSIVGLIVIAPGLKFLPIIGIFVAFPVPALASYFLKPGAWVIAAAGEMEPVVSPETKLWEALAA
jgi:hypothetical protein